MVDYDEIVRGLRAWTRNHDGHVRAAVELLITHETWIASTAFARVCIKTDRGESRIDWDRAAKFTSPNAPGSSSQKAILDFAVALGTDRFRLRFASDEDARASVRAVATATGLEEMLHA